MTIIPDRATSPDGDVRVYIREGRTVDDGLPVGGVIGFRSNSRR